MGRWEPGVPQPEGKGPGKDYPKRRRGGTGSGGETALQRSGIRALDKVKRKGKSRTPGRYECSEQRENGRGRSVKTLTGQIQDSPAGHRAGDCIYCRCDEGT